MRTYRAILCSAAALCAVAACGPDASAPESEWTRAYGGTLSYSATKLRVTADGGYIIGGIVTHPSYADLDIWLLRTKPDGSIVWQMTYGGPGWEQLSSLEATADGGYVVAGSTRSFGGGDWDAWVLKLDGSGSVVWQRTFGGSGYDRASTVQPTMDGGYIVAGTLSVSDSNRGGWMLKLDASGGVVWQRRYGGGSAASVKQSADGGYVVAAHSVLDVMKTTTDYQLLKLDASGNVTWERTYASNLNDNFSFLADQVTMMHLMADGGFLIAGITSPPGTPVGWSGWMLRLGASGDVVWSKSYPGGIASVQPIGDGHFLVAGAVHSRSDVYRSNPWVMKMDSGGNVVWQKTIPGHVGGFSEAQPMADGGYVVVGSTSPTQDGVTSALVLKLGSDGASADCANLAPFDQVPREMGVIKGNVPTIAVAVDLMPVISQAVPTPSTATMVESCGAAAN